jgi:hypothetical protein
MGRGGGGGNRQCVVNRAATSMEERESSVSKKSIQAPYTGPVSAGGPYTGLSRPRIQAPYLGARIRASPGPVYGACIWRAVYGPLQAPYTGPVSGVPYTGPLQAPYTGPVSGVPYTGPVFATS